jgi:protein TonB
MDNSFLKSFEILHEPVPSRFERLFPALVAGTVGLSLVLGWSLGTIPLPVDNPAELAKKMKVAFMLQEKKEAPKPEPKKEKPVDLTQKPVLKQPEEVAAPKVVVTKARPVYGVRKVYAVGLGGTGDGSAAIVTKLGNTLDKEPDTLVARPEDLQGPLVPVSTVTSAPALMNEVKPVYTPEMIEHKVAGLVRAKVLVDIDGAVNKIIMLEDIGHGSREAAFEAFKKLKFKPALRGDEAVAVWIIMKYRFVLQN